MKNRLRKLGLVLAFSIVLFAILLSVMRVVTPMLVPSRETLATWATLALQQPVSIQSVTAHWEGFSPVFTCRGVTVWNDQRTQQLLHANELRVGVNLFASLFYRQPRSRFISILGIKLTVIQQQDGQIKIVGLDTTPEAKRDTTELLTWVLAQRHLFFHDVTVNFINKEGKLLPISQLIVGLKNKGNFHRFWGQARVAQPELGFVHWVIDWRGHLRNQAQWQFRGFVNAKNIQLTRWLRERTYGGVALTQGIADVMLWGSWRRGYLQKWQSRFVVRDAILASQQKTAAQLRVNSALGHLAWQRTKHGGWRLAGDNLRLTLNGHAWPVHQFGVAFASPVDGISHTQAVQWSYFRPDDLQPLLLNSSLLSSSLRDVLTQLQPSGELHNFFAYFDDTPRASAVSAERPRWVVDTRFRQLSARPFQAIPGFSGLSGHLRAEPTQGAVALRSQRVTLEMTPLFRNALALNGLSGDFAWHRLADSGWQIQAKAVYAQNPDLQLYGDMTLDWPQNSQESPVIGLVAGFRVKDISHKSRYLPASLLKPRLLQWLDMAIVSGQIDSGTVLLQGKLRDFPFDDRKGTFIVDSYFTNTVLRYGADWPVLNQAKAELLFSGRTMAVNVNAGKIQNGQLSKVFARIPYLGKGVDAVLELHGTVTSSLNDGLQFLRLSPLREKLGDKLQAVRMGGSMVMDLQMSVPVEDTDAPTRLRGEVSTTNGALYLLDWNLVLDRIRGKLHFTEDSLTADGVKARFLGQPAALQVKTRQAANNTRVTEVTLAGNVAINDLQSQIVSPFWSYLTGKAAYQVLAQFSPSHDSMMLTSPLRGVAVNLPSPFAKEAQEEVPFILRSELGDSTQSRIKANYGKRLAAALIFKKSEKATRFYGGEVRIGGGDVAYPTQAGLFISGQLAELPWAAWKQYVKPDKAEKKTSMTRDFHAILRRIDLRIEHLDLLGQIFSPARLQMARGRGEWIFNLDTTPMRGELRLPDAVSQPWRANFQRCYLASGNTSAKPIKISDIPTVRFSCNDLRYGAKVFGHVEMDLQPVSSHTLRIQRLVASLPSYRLTANGVWQQGGGNSTTLSGFLSSTNLSATLQAWKLPPMIASQDAKANFDLTWPSAPHDFALKSVSGEVKLKLKHGSIVDVGSSTEMKMNLGKLLNLLSLENLQRRLRLDFSDLTSAGFGFDRLTGSFQLQRGDAFTKDIQLTGPVASVALNGRIGLVAEDYDVMLAVTPHMTSSIPVVATITGGPIAGVIALAADKVLSSGVQQLTTRHYKVTGPWQKPEVQPIGTWQQKLLPQW